MRDSEVTGLIKESAELAGEATRFQEEPDMNEIIHQAGSAGSDIRRFVWRGALSAAVLGVAILGLALVTGRPIPDSVIPESMAMLVDSLYGDGDYMVDEISPLLESQAGDMDEVWASVLEQTAD